MMEKISSGFGFTLVELMIVISIIAVLSAIAIVSFTNLQQNSRDAKRKSDLVMVQGALEQYHADQNYYPLPTGTSSNGFLTFGSSLNSPDGKRTYLGSVPTDPTSTTAPYSYETQPSSPACNNSSGNFCTNYCLYAHMENSSNGSFSIACPTPTPGGANYNYAVSAP